MRSLMQPTSWVKLAFGATVTVFVLHAVVFFTKTAPSFLHSDAATEVLLGVKALEMKRPLVPDFYYVNGDYWIFGGHWFAAPLILLLGVSPTTLFATNAFALAVEVLVLTWAFHRLEASWLAAAFAAVVSLVSWSTLHMYFSYVELAYGYIATCHFVVFVLFARVFLLRSPDEAPRELHRDTTIALVVFFLFAVQNPQRAVAFEVVPILLGCVWPWEGSSRPWRKRVAVLAVGTSLLALVVHRFVLRPLVTPAVQAGMWLGLRGPMGILRNVQLLGKGILTAVEPRDDFPISALLGLVVLVGAAAWAATSVLPARAYTPMRFVCLVVLAEVALVLGLLIFGDLLGEPKSVRYLMPSLLPLLGLGCLAAARAAVDARSARRTGLAVVWLCVLPIDAGLAASRRLSGPREVFSGADPAKQQRLADELVRHRLRHGFATYWNANALTLLSNGAAKTCGVAYRDEIVPRRWLVDTECFDAALLPPSIFFVAGSDEREAASLLFERTFPAPLERFTVDDFEVRVYRTADCPLSWLALQRPRLGD